MKQNCCIDGNCGLVGSYHFDATANRYALEVGIAAEDPALSISLKNEFTEYLKRS